MASNSAELVAPCGMNCALCAGYLSMKNDLKIKGIPIAACKGCRTGGRQCAYIKKGCQKILKEVNFCYECSDFPCHRIKTLDKRYSSRYHMSPIENLRYIQSNGMKMFLAWQAEKWRCPNCGEMICCHDGICFNCGQGKLRTKKHVYRWEDTDDPNPRKALRPRAAGQKIKDSQVSSSELLEQFATKTVSREQLYAEVARDFSLVPVVMLGISSSKASVRYGCAKILMDLSVERPEKVYPYFDEFLSMLASNYRILTWNALAIIANLSVADADKKFDANFDRYFGFLNDEYMVTVANVVGFSGKIAQAKPYLIPKIIAALLNVEKHPTTQHLTEECKRVIAEKTLGSFDEFFDKLYAEDKKKVLEFAKRCQNSSRKSLQQKAEAFLKRRA